MGILVPVISYGTVVKYLNYRKVPDDAANER